MLGLLRSSFFGRVRLVNFATDKCYTYGPRPTPRRPRRPQTFHVHGPSTSTTLRGRECDAPKFELWRRGGSGPLSAKGSPAPHRTRYISFRGPGPQGPPPATGDDGRRVNAGEQHTTRFPSSLSVQKSPIEQLRRDFPTPKDSEPKASALYLISRWPAETRTVRGVGAPRPFVEGRGSVARDKNVHSLGNFLSFLPKA